MSNNLQPSLCAWFITAFPWLNQVYRARTQDGEEVGVKVQRPLVQQAVARDILILRILVCCTFAFMSTHIPAACACSFWCRSVHVDRFVMPISARRQICQGDKSFAQMRQGAEQQHCAAAIAVMSRMITISLKSVGARRSYPLLVQAPR